MAENKRKYEDEIDFKALAKDPKRLFGWVFPYIFLIILLVGIFYVNNLTEMSLNASPISAPVEDEVKREIKMKKGKEVPPVELEVIQNPPEELVQQGSELYTQNCESCHGTEGLGDGPAGTALNPPPRNFTDSEDWTNGRDFINMYKTLEEGIVENGMASYEYLQPKEKIAIIHYVRTFSAFPEVTDDEVQEMNSTYSLSEGTVTSNQIPVDLAMQKLLEERSHQRVISGLVDYARNHPGVEGAEVFQRVSINNYRVFSTFYASNIENIDLDQFVQIATHNFNEIGFNAEVSRLEANELQRLFSYIKNVVSSVQGS